LQQFDNEWYVVCISSEVKRGNKRGITLFGRNIVIWRHSDGHVNALDAKCAGSALPSSKNRRARPSGPVFTVI
jgi:nitrite reductase/ring-hydroxylating ferredoxin subunit